MDAETINVAENTDLMNKSQGILEGIFEQYAGNIGAIIDVRPIKHICLVGNNCAPVQGTDQPPSLIPA
jgi:hypothetical protein